MSATTKRKKRRIVHIKKPTVKKQSKKNNSYSFKEELERLKQELYNLFNEKNSAKETKFLRRVAINIKELHFNTQRAKQYQKLRPLAAQIEHFLSTPWGAPFVSTTTLLQAADAYGEQDPLHCELSELLVQLAEHGPKFGGQVLEPLSSLDSHHDLTA